MSAEAAPAEKPSPTPSLTVQLAAAPAPLTTTAEIKAEIVRVFGSLANQALCIAQNESGFQPGATNHNTNNSWDVGIFQINDVHGMSWDDRLDARRNIAKAKEIRDAWGSWNAWSARHKCGL